MLLVHLHLAWGSVVERRPGEDPGGVGGVLGPLGRGSRFGDVIEGLSRAVTVCQSVVELPVRDQGLGGQGGVVPRLATKWQVCVISRLATRWLNGVVPRLTTRFLRRAGYIIDPV